jgi:hypothetical protein
MSKALDLDIVNSAFPVVLQYNLGLTQSVTSATVDMVNYDGTVNAFQFVGLVSGTTSPTNDTVLKESTDGTTWTTISSGSGGTFTQKTTSNTSQGLLFQRSGRYLRAEQVIGGTGTPNLNSTVFLIEALKQL